MNPGDSAVRITCKDEHRVRAVLLRKGLGLAWPLLLVLAVSAMGSGCAVLSWAGPVYGRVSNLSDEACSRSFSAAAERTLQQLCPRATHFAAASDSGASYGFLLQPRKSDECVLRLYERQRKGAPRSRTLSTTSQPAT